MKYFLLLVLVLITRDCFADDSDKYTGCMNTSGSYCYEKIMIRDQGYYSNYDTGSDTVSSKGMSLGNTTANSKNEVKVNAAALLFIKKIPTAEDTTSVWTNHEYMSVAWKRDVSDKSKVDYRDIGAGIIGQADLTEMAGLKPWETGHYVWLYPSIHIRQRTDVYSTDSGYAGWTEAGIKSTGLNRFIHKYIFQDVVSSANLYVYGGAINDHRTNEEGGKGNWSSTYGGASLDAGIDQITVSVSWEYFTDMNVPDGYSRRHGTITKPSISWNLNAGSGLQPSITLSREVGTDVRSSASSVNTTSITFSVKMN